MSRRVPSDIAGRGTATVVSHVLAIGITTVLLVALLMAAGGYLENQRSFVAREELTTVGHQLAGDLAEIDRLSRQDGTITVTRNLPDRIAGEPYSVRLRTGSACPRGVSTCLAVTMDTVDLGETIPLRNETELHVRELEQGRFELRSVRTTPRSDRLDPAELSMRVGVGRDYEPRFTGRTFPGGTTVFPPRNISISMIPRYPAAGEDIEFTGHADADDPENDGIDSWQWDFDDDGTYEQTGKTVTKSSGYPIGDHDITLNVTDDGMSRSKTITISVGGVTYQRGTFPTDGSPIDVTFRNTHSDEITIIGLFFDPLQDSVGRLDNGDDPEFTIHGDPVYLHVDKTYLVIPVCEDGEPIPEDGLAVGASWPDCSTRNPIETDVSAGRPFDLRIAGLESPASSEEYRVGLQYRAGDDGFFYEIDTRNLP